MSAPAHPRPPQVTVAGWMIIVGSLLVVGSVFETMGGLRSLETREAVDAFLADPPGSQLGWTQETVLTQLRIASMVTAGCATAAAVLGWHVLRRHRGARVGLTVLALPLFLAGVVTGGFVSSLVAAASLMLWLQPARDWFAGRAWTPPGASRARDVAPPLPPHDQALPPSGPGEGPRPVHGFGTPPPDVPPVTAPPAPLGQAPGQPLVRGKRPDVVLVAAIITWVFSGLTLLVVGLGLLVAASAPDQLMEEVERQQPELVEQGITQDVLLASTFTVGGLVLVWSVAAVVAAVLLVRGVRWSGTLLTVLAVATAVVGFASALSSLVMALPALAAVMVVVVLRRPDVRAWLAGRPRPDDVPPR